ncbi:hypothetical protein GCM10011506_10340 [Marivirga lumbricoides]|uniref:Beta-galactosidase jelly roll domain-containing protein n=3 Tax=Marivirga lumbricoides TaxID=1046115 RepID=A0ABQ1LUB0_9BACT|nr:hypothetical protein GCM10011506_10340 [Marivirga lumbricoides]
MISGSEMQGYAHIQPQHQVYHQDLTLAKDLKGAWKFNIGDNIEWKNPYYNDTKWEKVAVPADWENEGFNGYDGFAWYRIHFDGITLNQSELYFLVLGFIDDVDETYINGKLIGKSGSFPPRNRTAYNSHRSYSIPSEAINFKGDNVIAVRVFDEMGSGGIVAGEIGLYTLKKLNSSQMLQNLYGVWKFNKFNKSGFENPELDDSGWEDILAPAYWDNHGYKTLDGTAWYRKHFTLSFKQKPGKKYYLVLGKIDDFDITYLNGKKVGETYDGGGLGNSESFMQTRIYRIPEGLLKENSENVIAVKVIDIGLDGGIYEGPLGIFEEADLVHIREW